MKFGRWMALAMLAYGSCDAVFVLLAGVAMNVAVRKLWLPFGLFLYCGLVGTCLLYWANRCRNQTKSYPLRFSFAVFCYMALFLTALVFSLLRLRVIERIDLGDFAAWILFVAVGSSGLIYLKVRRQAAREQLRRNS